MKRQALLADRFLVTKLHEEMDWNQRKYVNLIRDTLRTAKRFVFTVEAAMHAANMVKRLPEAVAFAQEFAIPPFKEMYIEFPVKAYWQILNPEADPDSAADLNLGYLFKGPHVYVICEGYADGKSLTAALVPIRYNLWQPDVEEHLLKLAGKYTMSRQLLEAVREGRDSEEEVNPLDVLYWGSSFVQLPSDLQHSLRLNHSCTPLIPSARDDNAHAYWTRMISGAAGDLRNILALLLLINQPASTRYEEEVGHARGMIGNKPGVYLSHSRVSLHIDPLPQIRKVYLQKEHQGGTKRWHPVRGHFCHDKIARYQHPFPGEVPLDYQHTPEWQERDVNRWGCLKCGGQRWWREVPKGRGKKEVGQVETVYEVKP